MGLIHTRASKKRDKAAARLANDQSQDRSHRSGSHSGSLLLAEEPDVRLPGAS